MFLWHMADDALRIIVVEDESFISEMIKMMLEEMGYQVVGVAHNQQKASELIANLDFDFAILDINIEGKQEGIELAALVQEKDVPFMFLTSYADRNTLLEAKKSHPGAYVIKPFTEQELFAGIEMALMHHTSTNTKSIQIKDGHKAVLVNPDDILYVKADNIYIEVYTKNKKIVSRQTLSAFIEKLPEGQFIRVHRSFLINRNNVDSISKNKLEVGGAVIPISRSFKVELQNAFGVL